MLDDLDPIYKKRDIVSFLCEVGESRYIVKELLDHELLCYGKHHPYWTSDDEATADKLDEIRLAIGHIRGQLAEIEEKLS